MLIGNEIHSALPESESVFTERLRLFPDGCLVLEEAGQVGGYIMSFPIRHGKPPALNTMLGEIPPDADQYYLHDLAVLPGFRGRGSAAEGISRILDVAKRFPSTCLISVYGTTAFWNKYGFAPVPVDAAMQKLRGYGSDALYLFRKNDEGRRVGGIMVPDCDV